MAAGACMAVGMAFIGWFMSAAMLSHKLVFGVIKNWLEDASILFRDLLIFAITGVVSLFRYYGD
eukprot:CAMPEP_0170492878 /NCGR_PEP_ID=MMETSP0208-20121228/13019_1 /TAXON_ID=197538 /ORGANISM="Strombidium inclinatum, Strain S3" /LENGTH=63 /DNA_ID=CAMNT_0010768707 /DNA_START=112 /DNA_END=300 /DNA_ORIENTATION=+